MGSTSDWLANGQSSCARSRQGYCPRASSARVAPYQSAASGVPKQVDERVDRQFEIGFAPPGISEEEALLAPLAGILPGQGSEDQCVLPGAFRDFDVGDSSGEFAAQTNRKVHS